MVNFPKYRITIIWGEHHDAFTATQTKAFRRSRRGRPFYHRLLATNVSETAEIVALAEDAYGVPHVRFELTAHLSGKILDTGQRTLATAAFLADFRPGPPQELAAAS